MYKENIQPTFLATTALEEFWDTSQPMLFLHEWCQRYDARESWQDLDASLLEISGDRSEVPQKNQAIVGLCEHLLPTLADWMNNIHGVNHSLKYWRVFFFPFLYWYTVVLDDRLSYLDEVSRKYPEIQTIGLDPSCFHTPYNSIEWNELTCSSDAWNLQLMSQLLELTDRKPKRHKVYSWEKEKRQQENLLKPRRGIATWIKQKVLPLFPKCRLKKIIGVFTPHVFDGKEILSLLWKSRLNIFVLFSKFPSEENIPVVDIDLDVRKQLAKLPVSSKLGSLVLTTLVFNMPQRFIESYRVAVKEMERCYPFNIRLFVGGGDLLRDDQLRLFAAQCAEQGVPLIGLQHGGSYGEVEQELLLEEYVNDIFLSWGWQHHNKVLALPATLLSRHHVRKPKLSKKIILWVTTHHWRYGFIYSKYKSLLSSHVESEKHRFAKAITPELLPSVIMRAYPVDYGLFETERLREAVPQLPICTPGKRKDFFPQLFQAKILVLDHLCTTYLYGLILNIPTILFWGEDRELFSAEALPFFNEFKRVGIWQDNPEAAAEHLRNIADHPEEWWQQPDVQLARRRFCDRFGRTSKNYMDEWVKLLLDFSIAG